MTFALLVTVPPAACRYLYRESVSSGAIHEISCSPRADLACACCDVRGVVVRAGWVAHKVDEEQARGLVVLVDDVRGRQRVALVRVEVCDARLAAVPERLGNCDYAVEDWADGPLEGRASVVRGRNKRLRREGHNACERLESARTL